MRDVMLFSHANGFPVGTYRKMLGVLADEFDIRAVERFGHDPRFPVTRSWPGLVKELLAEIDAPVSYTHLTLPTNTVTCRSRWSPYH